MSDRMIRINSLIKQEVGLILQYNLKDKRLGFITVLRADISRDLKSGRLFVSILGSDDQKRVTVEILNKSAGYIQKLLGSRIRLRYTPRLRFIYDDVVDHSIHVQQVLDRIKQQDKLREHTEE